MTTEWTNWYAEEDPTTWVLATKLRERAEAHPDREYLRYGDGAWVTYGDMNSRANRIANGLIGNGTQRGESVSVMLPNCEEFLQVWFGILKAGAVMSSINTAYKGDFLTWTINLVEARTLFISEAFLDRLDFIQTELPLLERVVVVRGSGQVGPDPSPGTQRFSLDLPGLSDGIGLAVLAIGLIGLGDIIRHLGQPAALREAVTDSVHPRWPSRQDAQECGPAVLRGTALGALMGLLPGAGAWRASSASGAMEKKIAGARGRFGKGDVRGVAGPESAHSAGAQTSFIAVLALGLPLNAVMALMAGALLIQGLPPGPQLIASHPQLLWGLLGSMWVGQLVLAVVNLSLTGWWLRLLAVPYRHVFPVLTLLCCIGVYTLRGSSFDLYLVAFVAACGYAFHKLGCETAPLLLGFVLGPRMEDQLRGALRMSDGDWSLFLARPLSAALLVAAAGLLLAGLLPATRRERGAAFHDAD
jgi:TctA family transporter